MNDNHNTHTCGTRAYLSYIQGVTDKISRILKKSNITTSFKPLETIKQKMKFVKDSIDPKKLRGVYNIPCLCNISYIGETRWSFHTQIKEHEADMRIEQVCTSALAEHCAKTKHQICLENTKILAKENHYFKIKFREALKIIKHPDNLNRDGGLEVSANSLPSILKTKLSK